MALKHFLSPDDLTLLETKELLALAALLKNAPHRKDLAGKVLGMLFFDSSLRTRTSFDVGIYQLGGHATTLNVGEGTWKLEYRDDVIMDTDRPEHVREATRVLCEYVDALAVRSFPKYTEPWDQQRIDPVITAIARECTKPMINLESCMHHPCQALADAMTLKENIGELRGQPILISWAWHVNPLPMAVTNSILLEAAKHGMEVRLAHPEGWELDPELMRKSRDVAAAAGGSLNVYNDFEEALPGARAVYVKSWGAISRYGQPDAERAAARAHIGKWQFTANHINRTDKGIFMHCLPVRRGVEVTAEVLDSPASVVVQQAGNRLHAQKALLLKMLGTP